jgi:hypothetical protein
VTVDFGKRDGVVLAVIPSLNGDESDLRRLTDSLRRVHMEPIVAVTGARLDSELEASPVAHTSPKINAGFGATIARVADSNDWDWLAVVNDDITIDTNLLAPRLSGVLQEDPHELFLVYLDPGPSRPIPGLLAVILSIASVTSLLSRFRPVSAEVVGPSGDQSHGVFRPFSFAMISRGLWDRLSGFDSDFVYTYEDVDFARRAALIGADVMFLDNVGVVHAKSATGRPHIDRVLPVGVWSACVYLEKWGTPRVVARAACLVALACRIASVPLTNAPRFKHLRGIARAMGAVVTRKKPTLPDYGES